VLIVYRVNILQRLATTLFAKQFPMLIMLTHVYSTQRFL